MFKALKYSVLAASLGFGSTGPAISATLDTDVDVEMPSSLALYCYDHVLADFSAGVTGGNIPISLSGTATANSGSWTITGDPDAFDAGSEPYIFPIYSYLNLNNVCYFRALSSTGVAVSITSLDPLLRGNNGSVIITYGIRARDGDGGPWSTLYTTNTNGLGDVKSIDVRVGLYTRFAPEPGLYSSTTDGTFSVTIIASP